jgi:hypothetical protein
MQVGVAQAGIRGTQQNFAPFRLFDFNVFNGQRLVRCVKHRGFHN